MLLVFVLKTRENHRTVMELRKLGTTKCESQMRHLEATGIMEHDTFKRLENELRHLMQNRLEYMHVGSGIDGSINCRYEWTSKPLSSKSGFPDFLWYPMGHAFDLQ